MGNMDFIIVGEGALCYWITLQLKSRSDCRIVGLVANTRKTQKSIHQDFPEIPCIGPEIKNWSDWILERPCDYLLSVLNLRKIQCSVIEHPRIMALNFHDALLPKGAGLFAPQVGIGLGETKFGVTWHKVERGFDTGDIAEQESFSIIAQDSCESLEQKLFTAGQQTFQRLLTKLVAECVLLRPQELTKRSYNGVSSRPSSFLCQRSTPKHDLRNWVRSCGYTQKNFSWHFPMGRINGQWHLILDLHPLEKAGDMGGGHVKLMWNCAEERYIESPAHLTIDFDLLSSTEIKEWTIWLQPKLASTFQAERSLRQFGDEIASISQPHKQKQSNLTLDEISALMLADFRLGNHPTLSYSLKFHNEQPYKHWSNLDQLIAFSKASYFIPDPTLSLAENQGELMRHMRTSHDLGPTLKSFRTQQAETNWSIEFIENGKWRVEYSGNTPGGFAKLEEFIRDWEPYLNEPWNQIPKITIQEKKTLDQWGIGGFTSQPDDFINAIWKNIENHPQKIAVELGDQRSITFKQLGLCIRRQKQIWQTRGRDIFGENIVLQLPANFELLIAQLTIASYGGTFCSIHTNEKQSVASDIIFKTEARWGLTSKPILPNDSFWSGITHFDSFDVDSPLVDDSQRKASDTFAVLLTSGTSGTPKAVQVTRKGISNHLNHMLNLLNGKLNTRRSLVSGSPTFDGIFEHFFLPLMNAGTLVFQSKDAMKRMSNFNREIQCRKISILPLNTTLWGEWVNSDDFSIANHLKFVNVGGGRMEPKLVKKWFEACENAHVHPQLFNGYGPTETSVTCTLYPVRKEDSASDTIPVGHPQAGVIIRILGENNELVPPGKTGKIYIGGRGVSLGYKNDEERTNKVFGNFAALGGTFGGEQFNRFYDSGDYGHWNEKGTLIFEGRRDGQIKFRGFRVEIAFLESKITGHSMVRNCFIFHERFSGREELIAMVNFEASIIRKTPRDVSDSLDQIRLFVQEEIALHQQPSKIIELDAVPKTSSGKPSRQKIRNILIKQLLISAETEARGSSGQKEVCLSIMAESLGKEANSLDLGLSFQENGGDSLTAMIAQTKIEKYLKCELPLALFHGNDSIRHILKNIESPTDFGKSSKRVEVIGEFQKNIPTILIGHTYYGNPDMRNLWSGLNKRFNIVVLVCAEEIQLWLEENNGGDIREYASLFIEEIIVQVQDSPIFLLGFSWSAWLVWNVGLLLEEKGIDVKAAALGEPMLFAHKNDFWQILKRSKTKNSFTEKLAIKTRSFTKAQVLLYRVLRLIIRIRIGRPFQHGYSDDILDSNHLAWVKFHLNDVDGNKKRGEALQLILYRQVLQKDLIATSKMDILILHRPGYKNDFAFWKQLSSDEQKVHFQNVFVRTHPEVMRPTGMIEHYINGFFNRF